MNSGSDLPHINAYLILCMLLGLFFTTTSRSQEEFNQATCTKMLIDIIKNNNDKDITPHLNNLLDRCSESASVLHNLGVAHASLGSLDSAINYFEQSLKLQPLAQESYKSLNKIYRYRAVLAYRQALEFNSPEPKQPVFSTFLPKAKKNIKSQAIPSEDKLLDSLRTDLSPVLNTWWNGIKGEKNTEKLPDYLIHEGGKSLHIVLQVESNEVYSLQIKESLSGWTIVKESRLP